MPDISEDVENAIDTLKPGKWLNSLVGKAIGNPPTPHTLASPYSQDIREAWEVVKWCMDYADGDLFIEYWQDGEWFICNTNLFSRHEQPVIKARSNKVNADDASPPPSFPLAICRYALKHAVKMQILAPEIITDDPVTKD